VVGCCIGVMIMVAVVYATIERGNHTYEECLCYAMITVALLTFGIAWWCIDRKHMVSTRLSTSVVLMTIGMSLSLALNFWLYAHPGNHPTTRGALDAVLVLTAFITAMALVHAFIAVTAVIHEHSTVAVRR
jgi:hypothetical protein